MKKILMSFGLAAALTAFAGCSLLGTSTGYSRDNILDAVNIVVDRHDQYVNADTNLDTAQRAEALAESAAVTVLMRSDPVPKAQLDAVLPPVLDRTDQYVSSDTTLTAPQQTTRFRTTALLRLLTEK